MDFREAYMAMYTAAFGRWLPGGEGADGRGAQAVGGGDRRKQQRLQCKPEELLRCLEADMDIFSEDDRALLVHEMRTESARGAV